jgi:hypothetical protein
MVVRRDQKTGEPVFCRKCGYKTTITREDGPVRIAPPRLVLNAHGTLDQLQPEVDMVLIQALVEEAGRLLQP